ncbi:ABC transporter permease [Uliginosibacterium sp. 31-16]|uniref:ABC transporter permease n=1 Tax=Uliginosibacterium sp. 31-16 TaxID=3068315 RepID=UPI00273E81CC|nr:ABC transporter permease [Uliginosibacterium sp. 31-16]MDP5240345.1 ABC transporter permease [Uliginosibacterium sp. 31-16]
MTETRKATSQNPTRRAWQRFRANRVGYWSLVLFSLLFALSLAAEVLSNDKPLLVRYAGQWYFPIVQNLPETTFGGDFDSDTDYHDPFIRAQFEKAGNFAIFPLNPYHHRSINYFANSPSPAAPDSDNLLGTDDRGRDMIARLLYGFRLSVCFALLVCGLTTLMGLCYGAIQGFFAGWTDITMERGAEIWGAMPTLYMLIIFSALFSPSFWLLVLLIAAFGWLGIAAYVRAEFLRNRTLDYVRAARALGQSKRKIIFRHILPNSLTPVVTLLPFEMAGAIGALTSLDFLGLGMPPDTPGLGALLAQGKDNLDAWWISLSTIGVLVLTLLLLVLIGDALRDALDPRKVVEDAQ